MKWSIFVPRYKNPDMWEDSDQPRHELSLISLRFPREENKNALVMQCQIAQKKEHSDQHEGMPVFV